MQLGRVLKKVCTTKSLFNYNYFPSGFNHAMSQFILKKFLLLVLLLDHAKLTRLIDYDPCLFQKDSVIKVHVHVYNLNPLCIYTCM